MLHKTKNGGGSLKPFFILHIFIVLSFFSYQAQSYTSESTNSEKESFQDLILDQFSNSVNTELHARYPLSIEDLQELPGIGFNAFLNYPGDIGALTSDFVIDNYNLSDPRLQSIIRSFKPTHLRFNGGTPSNSMHNYSTLITRTNSASSAGQNNLTEHYFVEIDDIPQPTSPDLDYYVYEEGSFFRLRDFMRRDAETQDFDMDGTIDVPYSHLLTGLDSPAAILRRLSTRFAEGSQTSFDPDMGIYNVRFQNYLADFIDITMKDNISPVYVLKMFDPMNFVMDASIDGDPTNIQVSPILINRLGFTNYATADQGLQANFQLVRDRIKLDAKKEVRRQLIKYAYEYISHLSSTTVSSATFNAYMDDVENDALWSTNVSDMQANFSTEFEQIDDLDISFELGNELYTWWYYKFLPSNIFEYDMGAWSITDEKRTNADLYAEICVEAIASITTMFTEAKFGVVGSNRENNHGSCVWMDELESNADLMALDFAYILHYYAKYTADIDPSNALDPDNDDIPFILGEDNQNRVAEPVNHFFSRLDADDTGTDYLNQKSVWITESNTRELNEANTLIKETWFDLISKLNLMNQYLMRNSGDLSDLNSSAITNAGVLYNSSETAHLNIDILLSHTLYSNENNTALSITDNLDDPYNFWDLGLMHTIIGRLTENGNKSALPIVFTESPTATAIENTRFISPEGFHNGNQCHDGNGTVSDLLTNSPLVWGWQMLSDESSDCKSFKYLLVNSSNEECTLQGIDDYSEDNLDMFLFDFDGYSGTLTDLEITGNVIANIQDPDVFGQFLADGNLIYFTSSIDNLPAELDFSAGITMPPYSVIVLEGDPQSDNLSTELSTYFDFNEPTDYDILDGENVTFSGEDFDVLSNIEIANNGVLTINNGTTLRFAKDAGIIIKPGGRVNIEGGALLTSLNCNRLWQGITIEGDPTNMTQAWSTQGKVYFNSQSQIENAEIAFQIGSDDLDAGGFLLAENASFVNNVTDVSMQPYQRYNALGDEISNYTSFINCDFRTNDVLIDKSSPNAHISLRGVYGVDFTNCSFINSRSFEDEPFGENRGIGIRADFSTFFVNGNHLPEDGGPIATDARIEGLHRGILNSGFGSDFFRIRNMVFDQNYFGISSSVSTNSVLTNNHFYIPDNIEIGDEPFGAWFIDNNQFIIEENTFDGVGTETIDAFGLILDNCGGQSNLTRRNFYQDLFIGTGVRNDNRSDAGDGLQNKCNWYDNNSIDIYLSGDTEWKDLQGVDGSNSTTDIKELTNNRFSEDLPDCDLHDDFLIDDEYGSNSGSIAFTYYHLNDDNTNPDCPEAEGGDFRDDDVPPSFSGQAFNFFNLCEDQLDNVIVKPLPDLQTDFTEALGLQMGAENLLKTTVDGGDDDQLILEVQNTYANSSQWVRDLLVQNYPLSDDIMREAIMRATPMDPWHLTQVLLSNAPLSDGLTRFLEDSDVLSVFFMNFIFDANQNGNNNLRQLLELELAHRQEITYQAKRDWLMAIHAAGESDWQSQFGDLALAQDNDQALTYLTSSVLETDNVQAQNYINQLEDADLQTTWNLLINANETLSTAEQNTLMNRYLVEESDFGLALSKLNSESESILWPAFDLTYWMSRSTAANPFNATGVHNFEEGLQIFPNPGENAVYLTYDSQWADKGWIQIFDTQGRMIQSFKTNSSGIQEIQVKDWADGIYAVNLLYESLNVSTVKFIKQ